MRNAFQEQLDRLNGLLMSMARAVTTAMHRASEALQEANREVAEAVIAADARVDALRNEVDEQVGDLLARQQPVAGDLRFVLSCVRVAGDLERMGDLAEHVAKIALRRYPAHAVPPEAAAILAEMAEVGARMAAKTTVVLAMRDQIDAAQLGLDDDEMDALHRRLFGVLLSDWRYGVESAVDVALLGRFYERYADHAVNVARQVVYLVTGDVRLDGPVE